MSIRRAFIILAGVLSTCQILLAADLRQQWDQPNHKWIKGPVRCLLTPEEEKQFKALKTDEEISAFVKAFWAHRDPTPGTPENEFADLFWKRVAEAERLFPQTTEPGAISDRGQVYLLLGRATKTPNPGKTMDWVYENVPHVTPSTFTVQFSTGGGGNPLLLGRKGFEQIIAANEFLRGLGPKAAGGARDQHCLSARRPVHAGTLTRLSSLGPWPDRQRTSRPRAWPSSCRPICS